MSRGYAAIGLCDPKSGENVGGVMRACGVYGAALVVIAGKRYGKLRTFPTDTMKAWRHVPVIEAADVLDAVPFGCVPVAIEIVDGARSLPAYKHPERAFYIFGPEDGSVPMSVLARCRDVVSIPTRHCMNLAATANVVLYDRTAKEPRP